MFLHVIGLLFCLILFMSPRWIRWGWLWYVQILLTEWLSLSLVLGCFGAYFYPETLWFLGALGIYLYKRSSHLEVCGIESKESQNLNSALKPSWRGLLKNLIPFKRTPKAERWKMSSGENHLEHLKFSCSERRGVCLHFHGGAWRSGDVTQLAFIADFFKDHQIEMISVAYPKYPTQNLNEIVCSTQDALRWIFAAYDPQQKFILYGRSAGGHLALLMANYFPERIDKVIALYPVTDLVSLYELSNPQDLLKTPEWLKQVIGKDLFEDKPLYEKLSPRPAEGVVAPSVLLVHGANDPVISVQQSDLYFQNCVALQRPVAYLRFKFATHGFDALWNGLSMRTFRRVLAEFIIAK